MLMQSPSPRARPAVGGQRAPRIWLAILGLIFCTVAFRQVSDLDYSGAMRNCARHVS